MILLDVDRVTTLTKRPILSMPLSKIAEIGAMHNIFSASAGICFRVPLRIVGEYWPHRRHLWVARLYHYVYPLIPLKDTPWMM